MYDIAMLKTKIIY